MTTRNPTTERPPEGLEVASSELGQRLPLVMTLLGRSLRHAYTPIGVNLGQYPVLNSLLEHPDSSVSELAARERVKLPSMTAVVHQMESDGLVAKQADLSDRRCVRISLTPRGREVAEAARRARASWFAERLNHLSRAEVAAISRALPALEHLVHLDQ